MIIWNYLMSRGEAIGVEFKRAGNLAALIFVIAVAHKINPDPSWSDVINIAILAFVFWILAGVFRKGWGTR